MSKDKHGVKPTPETDAIAEAYARHRMKYGAKPSPESKAFHALPHELTVGHYRDLFLEKGYCAKDEKGALYWKRTEGDSTP